MTRADLIFFTEDHLLTYGGVFNKCHGFPLDLGGALGR